MTTPFNQADGNANVVWQSQTTNIGTLNTGPDASPDAGYAEGLANLRGGNGKRARDLIWQAMTRWKDQQVTSEVLFHWLVAMLSGRTAREFSVDEIDQLRKYQLWCARASGDPWADGVRLIYRLLGSVLRPPDSPPGPDLDAELLDKQFKTLGEKQRSMLLHLELFLSGPRRDKMWQEKLDDATYRQRRWHDRRKRAWVFFWPEPAEVKLPEPRPVADARLRARVSLLALVALVCFFAVLLLRHSALLGLLGCAVALAGGTAVTATDLERRFYRERGRRKGERSLLLSEEKSASNSVIDKRLQKYFDRYGQDAIARALWRNASNEVRRFYRNEVLGIFQRTGASIDEIDWYLRYEVHQMLRRGEDGILRIPPDQPAATRPAPVVSGAGWTAAALGCALAVFELKAFALWLAAGLIVAFLIRAGWLPAALRCRHHAADQQMRDQRQIGIDAEFVRWKDEWEHRPSDAEMAEWLELDRTVLLGKALEYFRLPRSHVVAHGFLERRKPGAKKGQRDGGLLRYQRYIIWVFLLANDGVRQLRATLDFLNGVLVEREELVYGYGSIAAVHVIRRRGGQTFELRLTGGEPVTVEVREANPATPPPNSHSGQADNAELADAEEDVPSAVNDNELDIASIANTLHLLEGVAADGRKWLQEHAWATVWTGNETRMRKETEPC